MVLLKNDGNILPLDTAKLHSIAVIGPNAATARIGGGGSGLVYAKNVVSPLDGIRTRAGSVKINYALGVGMPGEKPEQDTPEARQKLLDEAVAAAKSSDVALVFAGYSWKFETEGKDRPNMDLPAGQDELIQAVVAANPKTIVILNNGDPVDLTRWIDRVPALLDAWYPGEEAGNAVADLLFGDANPCGKLPFTFIRKLADSPSSANYPGTNLHVTLRRRHLRRLPLLRQTPRHRAALSLRLRPLVQHLRILQPQSPEKISGFRPGRSPRHCP